MILNNSIIYTIMDPFEQSVLNLLASKLKEAQHILSQKTSNEVSTEDVKESHDSQKERLPYNISKHVQYVQQDAYFRKRKALKKQTDIV
jgi:uncharacterized protein YjcR